MKKKTSTARSWANHKHIGKELALLGSLLVDRSEKTEYTGDLTDLGNEIGYVIGSQYKNMKETHIFDFITVLQHGFSLTNGTH